VIDFNLPHYSLCTFDFGLLSTDLSTLKTKQAHVLLIYWLLPRTQNIQLMVLICR